MSHLAPTEAAAVAMLARAIPGPVVMLNLLRFPETVDYADTPELAREHPISGAQAFDRYIEHTLPHLRASGGELLFLGSGGPWLIGPEGERWDAAMLVRQDSVAAFLAHARNEALMAGVGHRTAALLDARLLPLDQLPDRLSI